MKAIDSEDDGAQWGHGATAAQTRIHPTLIAASPPASPISMPSSSRTFTRRGLLLLLGALSEPRRVFMLALLLMAGAGAFATLAHRHSGPVVEGRHLTEWIQDLGSNDHGTRGRAAKVVASAGETALPHLRAFLQSEDGWLSMRLRQADVDVGRHFPSLLPAVEKRRRAALAATVLGTKAEPLVPELVRLLRDTQDNTAARALGAVGAAALPSLVATLSESDDDIRKRSIIAIVQIFQRTPVSMESKDEASNGKPPSGGITDELASLLPQVLMALRDNLEHESASVRDTAFWAIQRIESRSLPVAHSDR